MTKKRASEDALGTLHEALAKKYLAILNEGDPEKCTPAFLTSVAKFLKDNGIEVVPNTGSTLDDINIPLPKFDDDDDDADVRH